MDNQNVKYTYKIDEKRGIVIEADNDLSWFNSSLLGIGNLNEPSKPVEVLAVILDLEGFTTFTRQVDPKLAIPNFITDFYNWLFNKLKSEMLISDKSTMLWAELPFFCKFLGDGVLLLWNIDSEEISKLNKELDAGRISSLTQESICNIIGTLFDITEAYKVFLQQRDLNYVDPPTRLRCGIARGDAFSLGGGKDFVGPCINIASRLQKFSDLSFGISCRGIDSKYFGTGYHELFMQKKVSIRGIGENEIIYILESEFKKLPPEAKKLFR